jgi:hypothetical protein
LLCRIEEKGNEYSYALLKILTTPYSASFLKRNVGDGDIKQLIQEIPTIKYVSVKEKEVIEN